MQFPKDLILFTNIKFKVTKNIKRLKDLSDNRWGYTIINRKGKI